MSVEIGDVYHFAKGSRWFDVTVTKVTPNRVTFEGGDTAYASTKVFERDFIKGPSPSEEARVGRDKKPEVLGDFLSTIDHVLTGVGEGTTVDSFLNSMSIICKSETEPDFMRFKHKGIYCCIRRSTYGSLCGYARLPRGKLLSRVKKQRVKATRHHSKKLGKKFIEEYGLPVTYTARGLVTSVVEHLECHGGVTFAGSLPTIPVRKGFWVGFDCAHCDDLIPKMAFFTESRGVYRDIGYVTEQVKNLADQISAQS